jgi:carbamoyltransferase
MKSAHDATYVLGTGLSHDGSAVLLKDGKIAVAIEKERLTRRKHDGGNDEAAIRYCLDAEGITMAEVALVVQNENFGMFYGGNDWYQGARSLHQRPVVTISHHLAHAYSAFYCSPFERAAVLVIDGCGNNLADAMDTEGATVPVDPAPEVRHLYHEKDSYYLFGPEGCTPVYKDFSPWGFYMQGLAVQPPTTMHSIGGLYCALSTYTFSGMDDSGKLMGLAPYGRPGVFDFEMFDLREGRVFVRYDWMKAFAKPVRANEDFKENFQHYADLARHAQSEVERAILYTVNSRYEYAPSENLAFAGGVALNAVANRRIQKESRFKNVFFQPAAGDNGLAIGCAYYGWHAVLKRERVLHSGATCFGRQYEQARIAAALQGKAAMIRYEAYPDYIQRTAEILAARRVVAWFQDGSEFGPRALGHRSILADPRIAEMRDHINAHIKFREDFRPFAPAVLREDSSLYFDCEVESPYMLLVSEVREEWRDKIPSVVHRNHSARVQTVTRESDAKFHELITCFKKLTGLSVLLNTSFNRRGMPIVETPEEAVEFFLASAIDVLVIGPYIATKRVEVAQIDVL